MNSLRYHTTDNQAELLPRIRAERAARAAAHTSPGAQLQARFDEEAAHFTVRRLRHHVGDWSIRNEPLFPARDGSFVRGVLFVIAAEAAALTLAALAWGLSWIIIP